NDGGRTRRSQTEQTRIDAPALKILSHKVPCNVVTQSRNRSRFPPEECETSGYIPARTACIKLRSGIIKTKNNIQSTQPRCDQPWLLRRFCLTHSNSQRAKGIEACSHWLAGPDRRKSPSTRIRALQRV